MSDNPEARKPGWRVVADDGSHEWECDCYGDLSDCPKRFEGSCHARTIPNAEDRRVTALEATNAEQARQIWGLREALKEMAKSLGHARHDHFGEAPVVRWNGLVLATEAAIAIARAALANE